MWTCWRPRSPRPDTSRGDRAVDAEVQARAFATGAIRGTGSNVFGVVESGSQDSASRFCEQKHRDQPRTETIVTRIAHDGEPAPCPGSGVTYHTIKRGVLHYDAEHAAAGTAPPPSGSGFC
jgi:hypothetical protein